MELDVWVPLIDLLAFALITPEIFGEERISAIMRTLDNLYDAAVAVLLIFLRIPVTKPIPSLRASFAILLIPQIAIIMVFIYSMRRFSSSIRDFLTNVTLPNDFILCAAGAVSGYILCIVGIIIMHLLLQVIRFFFAKFISRNVVVAAAIILFTSARYIEFSTRLAAHQQ